MPAIDDLLATESRRWQEAVDARCAAVRWPRPRPAARRRPLPGPARAAIATAAAAAAVLVAHTAGVHLPDRAGSADCAPPMLTYHRAGVGAARPPVRPVAPGQVVEVYGGGYLSDPVGHAECGSRPQPRPVVLRLLVRGKPVADLGSVRPHGRSGRFRIRVTIPGDAPAGPAVIGAGGRQYRSQWLRVVIDPAPGRS